MLGIFLVRCDEDFENNIMVAATFLIGLLTAKLFYQKTKAQNVFFEIEGFNFKENIEMKETKK